MAATSLWKVSGRLDNVLKYAGNEKKTANPVFNESELQGLRDVMDYTYRDYKTEKQHYISGINCSPETARQEMVDTKLQYREIFFKVPKPSGGKDEVSNMAYVHKHCQQIYLERRSKE